MENRGIISLGDVDDNWLIMAFIRKVLLQPLAKHRSVDTNDVIRSCVVVSRPAEDFVAYLMLTDFLRTVEHALTKIDE